MQYSYDNILSKMNDKFMELSGYEADEVSDVGIKMKVLAGEIFSLVSEIESAKKQMFVTTATGEKLELHSALAGTERLRGNKSHGMIMFRLDVPLEYEVTIPKGTVCTNSNGTLNFVTSEDAKIERGETFAFVESEAEKSGSQYNVSPGEVTTIVTYFSVGIGISNSTSFVGGSDDENDEELRKRTVELMRNKPNGLNKKYYISLAESVEGVNSASVSEGNSQKYSISIYIAGKGKTVEESVLRKVQDKITANKSVGIDISVSNASAVKVNVSVQLTTINGYLFNDVKGPVEDAIHKFFENIAIGNSVTAAALGNVIYSVPGVGNYKFINFNDVSIGLKQFAVLGTLTVEQIPNYTEVM